MTCLPRIHLSLARRIVGAVVLTLLLSQWSSLAHSIQHIALATSVTASTDAGDTWGHQAGAPACHLIDHLLTGQAPGVHTPPVPCIDFVPVQVAASVVSLGHGLVLRAYEARGPPPV